jgi:hypothetical protein
MNSNECQCLAEESVTNIGYLGQPKNFIILEDAKDAQSVKYL